MKIQQTTKLRTYEDSEKFQSKMNYPRIAMIKYDGRCTTIMVHVYGGVDYYTSGGKHFKLIDDQIFADVPAGVYFAEMMGEGVDGKLGDRVHSGIQTNMVTRTKKGLPNRHKPNWRIFDYVDWASYNIGHCELPFVDRWSWLKTKVPTQYLAFDMECLNPSHYDMFHSKVVADGWEGTVCIDYRQEWKASKSRPHTQVKRKDLMTLDLAVVEEIEGGGKYEGMIGALRCVDGTGKEVCTVGSGLTDDQRSQWGAFIGKIVEVRYEQIIDKLLVQPTFQHVRDDKFEADKV